MKKETVKPPLGLKPKWLHDEQRHAELVSAIKRRLKKGVDIPDEWIREYKNYVQSKNNKQSIQDAKDKVFNELDSQDFKKGDVLIRYLKDDVIACLIIYNCDNNSAFGEYYEFFLNGTTISYYEKEYNTSIKDWRKATQEEIDKLNKLLGKEVEKVEVDEEKEVWWLCNKSMGDYFLKGKKYKQEYLGKNIITLIDNFNNEHNLFIENIYSFFSLR